MDVHPSIGSSLWHSLRGESNRSTSGRDHDDEKTRHKSFDLLLSGAIAGATAKTAIAPMDRLKILFQTNPVLAFNRGNVSNLAREIYGRAGVRAFWKGHTATLVRVIPYSATNFFVFERTRHFLDDTSSLRQSPVLLRFVSGAVSGSVAVIVTYPLETLRARLAADLLSQYDRGYIQAIRNIIRVDGLRSLYSGLRPTLVGIVPYAGTSFAVYETLKTENATFGQRLLIGAVAGFMAQAATYPLDVVRRRMQVRPNEYTSVLSTFKKIATREGVVRGFYKGLSMNLIKGPIAVSISLTCNDHLKRYFSNI